MIILCCICIADTILILYANNCFIFTIIIRQLIFKIATIFDEREQLVYSTYGSSKNIQDSDKLKQKFIKMISILNS